jgi:hypothetical protein
LNDQNFSVNIYIYIERERELGYGTTRSTDDPCVMGRFSVFKVQMIDPTGQNIFSYENLVGNQILYFLGFFYYFLR